MKVNYTQTKLHTYDQLEIGAVYVTELSNMPLIRVSGNKAHGLVDLKDGTFYEAIEGGWVRDASFIKLDAELSIHKAE